MTPCTVCGTQNGSMRYHTREGSLCGLCTQAREEQRRAKMAVRQNPAQFDICKLVNKLLTQHWMHECEIRTHEDGKVTVKWGERYLRHSAGPGTGTFWDIYGDNFHSPELALVELSKAYPPPHVDQVIATHGN